MWADTALGRLLEVQDERLPGQADADRHVEELSPGTQWQLVAMGTDRAIGAGLAGRVGLARLGFPAGGTCVTGRAG
jgi:hypothetical protein